MLDAETVAWTVCPPQSDAAAELHELCTTIDFFWLVQQSLAMRLRENKAQSPQHGGGVQVASDIEDSDGIDSGHEDRLWDESDGIDSGHEDLLWDKLVEDYENVTKESERAAVGKIIPKDQNPSTHGERRHHPATVAFLKSSGQATSRRRPASVAAMIPKNKILKTRHIEAKSSGTTPKTTKNCNSEETSGSRFQPPPLPPPPLSSHLMLPPPLVEHHEPSAVASVSCYMQTGNYSITEEVEVHWQHSDTVGDLLRSVKQLLQRIDPEDMVDVYCSVEGSEMKCVESNTALASCGGGHFIVTCELCSPDS